MKAVRVARFGAPEEMKIEKVEELKPGPGQVLVKVMAAGVNPVDAYIRSGTYKIKPALPYTPGFDAAGIVEAAGEGARRFKAGDRVYTAFAQTGSYAEKALVNEANLYPLPANLSFGEGASLGIPYATAYRAIWQKACARPGDTLLIHGASGGVGIAAVQIARAAGMKVIGTAGTEKGLKLVKEQGADFVFNHKEAGYLEKIREASGGNGPGIILEMLANVNLQKDLELLAKGGRVVVIGCRGEIEINPRLMMGNETSIIGMTLFNASKEDLDAVHAGLRGAGTAGILKPVIGTELPLEGVVKAHHQLLEDSAYGKIILKP